MAWHAPGELDAPDLQLASTRTVRPRADLDSPRLSVVIVNYRQWKETARLVRQLLQSPAVRKGQVEVVIVDNHSPAHPLMRKLRRWPHVSLRRWQKNQGFASAVNEGCRLSRGDWFLLLNPDITLSEGFLESVLARAENHQTTETRVGIVGFHLRNSDGTQQLSTGKIPTLLSVVGRLMLPRQARKYQLVRTAEACQVPWVTGCCVLLRRDCWEELGGLDESFFLYYEDVDLCVRAQKKGWSVWYEPGLTVIHHHPLHQRPLPAALRLVTRHSLLTFAEKFWPSWQKNLLARLIHLEGACRSLWAGWHGNGHERYYFDQLRQLADEFLDDRSAEARERLDRSIQRLDLRVGV